MPEKVKLDRQFSNEKVGVIRFNPSVTESGTLGMLATELEKRFKYKVMMIPDFSLPISHVVTWVSKP